MYASQLNLSFSLPFHGFPYPNTCFCCDRFVLSTFKCDGFSRHNERYHCGEKKVAFSLPNDDSVRPNQHVRMRIRGRLEQPSATSPIFFDNLHFDKHFKVDLWLTILSKGSKWRLSKKMGLVADGWFIFRGVSTGCRGQTDGGQAEETILGTFVDSFIRTFRGLGYSI